MRVVGALTIVLVALVALARADDAANAAYKNNAGCKTPLDLIASQNPNLPMHPVFQEILNSPSLKGTFFVPTAKAWDAFFSTVRQRQGNPEAPAMVARYGQVMLYHLAQNIAVPIATPTPGANKFAFDTASTLQCSVGPGLPNNRVVVRKTPQAIFLEHGTGNATIVSQPIGYCGGEAYLVDQVLVPCSDVSAIMGEIANVPSPCKNNVEGVLQRDGLGYYNALLLATGVNRPIFAAVRNFTIFAPTDAAIQSAYDAGTFDYAQLFATDKATLAGVVAYHAVPQVAITAPGKYTGAMSTMLDQGQGKASCPKPALSWRPDGFVYGGTGAGKVSGTYDRGCAAVIFQIDSLLQPCCKKMTELLGGMRAAPGSMTQRMISFLKAKIEDDGTRASYVMPTETAWQNLFDEASYNNATIAFNDAELNALVSYLYTGADVSDVVENATPVKTALAMDIKSLKAVCKRPTNGTLIFTYDERDAAPVSDAVMPAGVAPATPAAGPAMMAPMTGLGVAGPGLAAPGLQATALPMTTAPPMAATALPGSGAAVAATSGQRRLLATKLPTKADSLLLPTTFTAGGASQRDGPSIVNGPLLVVDGSAIEMRSGMGIPVSSITYACDGTIFHVNAVPLPCNLINRRVAMRAPPPAPKPAILPMTISAALVNTTNIPGAVPNTTAAVPMTATSAASTVLAPLLGSVAAAVLLAAVLL